MDTKTDTTTIFRPQPFGRRLWLWLTQHGRRRASPADLDTLSDRKLRDIGSERDTIDQMAIRALHDPYSG
jgi:uncharacterized protein YjiS (DUF1127 family)